MVQETITLLLYDLHVFLMICKSAFVWNKSFDTYKSDFYTLIKQKQTNPPTPAPGPKTHTNPPNEFNPKDDWKIF